MSVFDTFLNLQWIGLGSVPEFIIEFFLWLDSIIYSFVGKILTLFMDLASVDYIFNIDNFQYIIDRLYIVLGVIVLFIVAINLLQYVINPDRDDGKSLRDIAFRVVKVLILVVLTPTMFEILYNVQHAVISYNVIPRLLLSDSVQEEFNSTDEFTVTVDKSEDTTGEYSDIQDSYTYTKDEMVDSIVEISGNEMAWYVYSGFFYEDDGNTGAEYDIAERLGDKHSWAGWLATGIVGGLLLFLGAPGWVALGAGGIFGLATNSWTIDTQHYTFEMLQVQVLGGDWDMITAFAPFVQDGSINYLFILSTIAGLFLVYVIFSFCLDLGVRAIKLIFYQVVAPVCFLLSIVPSKESTIKNWFSAVGATWLEVFVRIACICLIVVGTNLIGSIELPSDSFFVKAILIMSIVAFVRMLPKLFSDITGIKSGNMKLGIKDKLIAGGGLFAAGAAATVGAGALGTIRNIAKSRRANESWGTALKSGLAGGASAATRTAYNARHAKGFKDIAAASGKGLAGAAKARADRIAYRAKHGGTTAGVVKGHITDFVDWLSGAGVEDLDYVIKSAGDVNKANDDFRGAIKKQWDKHITDSTIVAKMTQDDFKGDNAEELFRLYSEYVDENGNVRSASAIKQDIEQQRESVRKTDYTELARQQMGAAPVMPTKERFENPDGKIDEEAYNKAVEEYNKAMEKRTTDITTLARKLSIEAATRIGYLDSMYSQLEKESITRLGQIALDGNVSKLGKTTMKVEDLYEARLAGERAQSIIRDSGLPLEDPSKIDKDTGKATTIKVENGNYAKFIDDIAGAVNKQATFAMNEKRKYLDKKEK